MNSKILNDRYEILQQLGKRTGRETLLSRDISTQKLVVLKLLKFNSEFEWDDLKLFEREAQTLQDLSHPQIPQYLDFFEFEVPQYKGFALVQTYLEAKSLEQHRQAGRTFTEDEVKQIAEQLLEILSYLHDRHPPVIHRDLKPSNILLGDRSAHSVGKVYLVDFGSVQNMAAVEGGTFTVVGTYGYMPPEQFGGRTVPASDLYSLGATLVYLLTGRHPADLPQKNLQIDIAKVAKLSPNFEQWLGKLLEPSLDRRFSLSEVALEQLYSSQTNSSIDSISKKPLNSKIDIFKTFDMFKTRFSSNIFNRYPEGFSIFLYKLLFASLSAFLSVFFILVRDSIPFLKILIEEYFVLYCTFWFIFPPLIFFIILSSVSIEITIDKNSIIVTEKFVNVLFRYEKNKKDQIKAIANIEKCIYPYPEFERLKKQKKMNHYNFIAKRMAVRTNSVGEKHLLENLRNPPIQLMQMLRPARWNCQSHTALSYIVIYVDKHAYKIQPTTQAEVDWLGYELSDWLGLPLEYCYIQEVAG